MRNVTKNNMLDGAATVLDLLPPPRKAAEVAKKAADALAVVGHALAGDWQKVGMDLERALTMHHSSLSHQKLKDAIDAMDRARRVQEEVLRTTVQDYQRMERYARQLERTRSSLDAATASRLDHWEEESRRRVQEVTRAEVEASRPPRPPSDDRQCGLFERLGVDG